MCSLGISNKSISYNKLGGLVRHGTDRQERGWPSAFNALIIMPLITLIMPSSYGGITTTKTIRCHPSCNLFPAVILF